MQYMHECKYYYYNNMQSNFDTWFSPYADAAGEDQRRGPSATASLFQQ